jgi:tetratricopeptide (TPR) repeat protein
MSTKIPTYKISVFFFVAYMCFAQNTYSQDESSKAHFQSQIFMYKDTYLLREPIWIKLTTTNVSVDTQEASLSGLTGMVITSDVGNTYRSHVHSGSYIKYPSFVPYTYDFDLLNYYGEKECKIHVRYYLPPGKYEIYHQVLSNVRSNTFNFEVLEPTGDELEAMRMLKEGYELTYVQKKHASSIKQFKKIVDKFPNSIYAPLALRQQALRYNHSLKNKREAISTYRKIVTEYPTSRMAIEVIGNIEVLYMNLKDREGCEKELQSLIKKYPNTEISKEAEDRLRKLDPKDFE